MWQSNIYRSGSKADSKYAGREGSLLNLMLTFEQQPRSTAIVEFANPGSIPNDG